MVGKVKGADSYNKFLTPNINHGVEGKSAGRKIVQTSKNLSQITLGKIHRILGLMTEGAWMNNKAIASRVEGLKKSFNHEYDKFDRLANAGEDIPSEKIIKLQKQVTGFVKFIEKLKIDKNMSSQVRDGKNIESLSNSLIKLSESLLHSERNELVKAREEARLKIANLHKNNTEKSEINALLDIEFPQLDRDQLAAMSSKEIKETIAGYKAKVKELNSQFIKGLHAKQEIDSVSKSHAKARKEIENIQRMLAPSLEDALVTDKVNGLIPKLDLKAIRDMSSKEKKKLIKEFEKTVEELENSKVVQNYKRSESANIVQRVRFKRFEPPKASKASKG